MQPTGRLLRLSQIIRTPTSEDGFEPLVPIRPSAWWVGVKRGHYPPAIKLGGSTFWREADVRRLVETGDWREPVAESAA